MKLSDIEVTLVDLAWTAGFIDGEGCITSTNTSMQVKVSHTHLPSLEFLQQRFGGYLHERNGSKKQAWVWAVHGDEANSFLVKLYPHLKEKKKQALIAMQLHFSRPGRGIKPSDELKQHREKLRKQLSDLKK